VAVALALVAACLLVYGQAARFDFINYDDGAYVADNPPVRAGFTRAGLVWAFTTIDYFYWQPLTWLSHILDCQLFGVNPGPHHLHNVLLHTLNALLVFAVFLRLTGALWRSALLAAVFALHPLRIESVAWVAERKDLLSAFCLLVTLWCYLGYARRPSRPRYYLVLAMFALGLMAKPMAMSLAVILLLLDYWPLGRRAFAEKIPMFGLAALSTAITWIGTHRLGPINWGAGLSMPQRLANAAVSYVKYLELAVWPHGLAVLYPFRTAVPLWQCALAALLLLAITGAALRLRRDRPYLFVGWLWFVTGILPASGLVQVGRQGMADRFTYIPMLGLAVAAIWYAADSIGKRPRAAAAISASVVAALGVITWIDLPVWRNSVTVFAQAVAVTRENSLAQHQLAAALDDAGRYQEALPHHAEAVRIEPAYFVAQCSYALALEKANQTEAAIDHFRQALRYFPDYPEAREHLAANLRRVGRPEEAAKVLDPSKASGLTLKQER